MICPRGAYNDATSSLALMNVLVTLNQMPPGFQPPAAAV
jgi:hypothetical protein